ncbi:MAG: DUF1992 domain-containing protein [Ornithinimicrobium sp.]
MSTERNSSQDADGPRRRRKQDEPATPEQIDSWVEHSIKAAQRRGDFDNLPGAGKPLAGLDQPNDPDWWIKGLIQREKIDLSVALPGPMALRRERATYPEALADISDEDRVREILLDFNERVLADRRRPVATAASPVVAGRVDVDAMVERWRALRIALAVAASDNPTSGDCDLPDSASADRRAPGRFSTEPVAARKRWARWRRR